MPPTFNHNVNSEQRGQVDTCMKAPNISFIVYTQPLSPLRVAKQRTNRQEIFINQENDTEKPWSETKSD